ncbi:MAG TPA: leucine-rich repeat protein, partial [Candidatus Wallbacteria bacterium]|nr:leucine-rich repeat protein [Candidatus Wallbacteria bacterium]
MSSTDKVDITVTGGFAARASFILEVLSWKVAEFRKELASKSWLFYKKTLDFNIADPIISPGGGNYTGPQDVAISCSTAGATIRYTDDGSEPTSSRGWIYSSPIKVSESTLIKAIAYTFETNCSKVVTAEIIINDIPVPQPTPSNNFGFKCLTHNDLSYLCAASGCQGPISTSPYSGLNMSSIYSLIMPSVCVEEVTIDGEKRTITRPVYECKIIGTDNFESVKVPEGVQTVNINASGSIKKVILPSTLKTIQKCHSKGLVEVVIPYGVTEINDSGLSSNPNLSSIDLPSSLKKIGNGAFSGSALTKITIPDSVTEIGEEAFSNCNKLVEVT